MPNPLRSIRHLQALQRAGIDRLIDPGLRAALDAVPAVTASEPTGNEGSSKPIALMKSGPESAGNSSSTSGPRQGMPRLPAIPAPIPVAKPVVPTMPREVVYERSPTLSELGSDERTSALLVIQQEVEGCTRCESLVSNRTRTVFGAGNPRARLVMLGEAPGADEDRIGIPFVGRSGQLLDRILAACGIRREEIYILNTVKCRPPNNRAPEPEEMHACRGFLERQLQIIQPEFICCLGLVAATGLLQRKVSLGSLRGKLHAWGGSQVLVTYHPSYLLRNPPAKAWTWDDMRLLMQAMGIEIPTPPASSTSGDVQNQET